MPHPSLCCSLDQIWQPRKLETREREHREWRRPRNPTTITRRGSTATWRSRWCSTASCSLWWALPGYSSVFTTSSTQTTLTHRNSATTHWSSSSGPSAASIYCEEASSSSSLSARIQSWTRWAEQRHNKTQLTKPISLPPQVSKLTVCGVRLTFLQRKHLQHFDSVISKVIRAEWCTAVIRDHHVATPALLCHKELAQLLGALGRNTPNWVCLLLWHRGTDLGASIVRFNQWDLDNLDQWECSTHDQRLRTVLVLIFYILHRELASWTQPEGITAGM